MSSKEYVELMGVPGSPYTRKMLALMRYRRIPYRLLPTARYRSQDDQGRFRPRPEPKVGLLPTFYFTDESGVEYAACDSTPIVRQLELDYPGRETVPQNAVLEFFNYLIEDYADEWLTKAMFHYRWSYAPDIWKAGQILPRWGNTTGDEAALQEKAEKVTQHQISRLAYVGSNQITGAIIEDSFTRFLKALDKHLQLLPFILGKRPSSCDFAIYGQLTCMALFDPTPQALILKHSPRVYAWTETLEDLSGYELTTDDWLETESAPGTLLDLLSEIWRMYPDYLIANAAAIEQGEGEFECQIDGKLWQQSTFPYQAKCLKWIRECFHSLSKKHQEAVLTLCNKTGNERLIS